MPDQIQAMSGITSRRPMTSGQGIRRRACSRSYLWIISLSHIHRRFVLRSLPMKRTILKVAALGLLVWTPFLILTCLSDGQSSPNQNITAQAAPSEKEVEQAFTNIKVLNGMPQSQLYPTMRFMAASLGFQCGSCHVFKNGQLDSAADDKPEKQTARAMIR